MHSWLKLALQKGDCLLFAETFQRNSEQGILSDILLPLHGGSSKWWGQYGEDGSYRNSHLSDAPQGHYWTNRQRYFANFCEVAGADPWRREQLKNVKSIWIVLV